MYPSVKASGNFGQLSRDHYDAGASEIRDWISNGISPTEIAALKSSGLIPLSCILPAWTGRGNPGFKAPTVMEVNDHAGQIFILPLFKAYSKGDGNGKEGKGYEAGVGNGSDYNYNIVQFVAIRLMEPGEPGNYRTAGSLRGPQSYL